MSVVAGRSHCELRVGVIVGSCYGLGTDDDGDVVHQRPSSSFEVKSKSKGCDE